MIYSSHSKIVAYEWNLPLGAATFASALARMLWIFAFRIAHTMVEHTAGTFHPSYLFEAIFEAIGSEFACSFPIEFFGVEFLAISV